MALKDWKIIYKSKGNVVNGGMIYAKKNYGTRLYIINQEPGNWFVELKDSTGSGLMMIEVGQFRKIFSTKSKALAYAKEYMKNN